MIALLTLLLCGAWAFYIALLIDRPDLAATIVPAGDMLVVNAVFAVFFLITVYRLSHLEISRSKSMIRNGPGIYLRNLVVIGLGVGLIVFACREVLHGVDPTGRRALFG